MRDIATMMPKFCRPSAAQHSHQLGRTIARRKSPAALYAPGVLDQGYDLAATRAPLPERGSGLIGNLSPFSRNDHSIGQASATGRGSGGARSRNALVIRIPAASNRYGLSRAIPSWQRAMSGSHQPAAGTVRAVGISRSPAGYRPGSALDGERFCFFSLKDPLLSAVLEDYRALSPQ